MIPSTPLRQRLIEDMQLHGFAAKTQDAYVRAVRQLAEHYHKSPDLITEEELRQYLLYLTNEKHVAASTFTVTLCGPKFFYEQTLQRTWATLEFGPPRTPTHHPSIPCELIHHLRRDGVALCGRLMLFRTLLRPNPSRSGPPSADRTPPHAA